MTLTPTRTCLGSKHLGTTPQGPPSGHWGGPNLCQQAAQGSRFCTWKEHVRVADLYLPMKNSYSASRTQLRLYYFERYFQKPCGNSSVLRACFSMIIMKIKLCLTCLKRSNGCGCILGSLEVYYVLI